MTEKRILIKETGFNVSCLLYCNQIREIRSTVIAVHGFAGHKANRTFAKFSEKLLSKRKDASVLCFDLPAHGDDVSPCVTVCACDAYLTYVIRYARESLKAENLFALATSFGGYLVLRYIREHADPFERIALRCPAVNMYDTFTEHILSPEQMNLLKKGKYVPAGFDRKVSVGMDFLNDLRSFDVTKQDYLDVCETIRIVHGGKDEIISPDTVRFFADNNLIETLFLENADHRFSDPQILSVSLADANSFLYGSR